MFVHLQWGPLWLVVAVALVGCGGPERLPISPSPRDGGHGTDASTSVDGSRGDAGVADAGSSVPDGGDVADAGTVRDAGRRDAGTVVPHRHLILLVSHNGVRPLVNRSTTLQEMTDAESYFLRSSCGLLDYAGIEHPDQPADIFEVDLGEIRAACDGEDDCLGFETCEGDTIPEDGLAEGRCNCGAAHVAARARAWANANIVGDYDSVAILFNPSESSSCRMGACATSSDYYTCAVVLPHEMGHVHGFDHAGRLNDLECYTSGGEFCDVVEYGDTEDVMGYAGSAGHTMNLPHLLGAGWLAGRRVVTTSGTHCVHPFDPPRSAPEAFCSDRATTRGLELPVRITGPGDVIYVGYRGETDLVQVYGTYGSGGDMGRTTLIASLENAGRTLTVASSPSRHAFEVTRGATCEGDGVEVTVR